MEDFSENHLVQISNEDTTKDARFRIDSFSYCDFIEFNLIFILTVITVSLITIFAFHQYGISENSFYLDREHGNNLIKISPINIIPFSSFFRIYFQVVQTKKNKTKENLKIDISMIETFLNAQRNKVENYNFSYNPTIYFDGKSSISSSSTLISSHYTSNFSIVLILKTTFNKNDNKIIISFESGSKSTVIFSFILKFSFLILSIIIFILIIWSQRYSDLYINYKNFKIAAFLWIALIFNSFFYSYQIYSFLFFIFSFITTATFKILSKLAIIYFISSVRYNRNSDYKMMEDQFVYLGYILFSLFDFISTFLKSISMFNYDQLKSELTGMKVEFVVNIVFTVFIICEFIQSKSLIESQERIKLLAFFSLSLIFLIENIIVQYFIAIKDIYFCQQAFNNINYATSCAFVIMLLIYNWPAEEDYQMYYQQDLEVDDEELLQ